MKNSVSNNRTGTAVPGRGRTSASGRGSSLRGSRGPPLGRGRASNADFEPGGALYHWRGRGDSTPPSSPPVGGGGF